jgi:hypothetical protein
MALSSPRKLIDKDLEPTYRVILQHITCTSCTRVFPKSMIQGFFSAFSHPALLDHNAYEAL